MLQKAIVSTVDFCIRYATQIIVLALLLVWAPASMRPTISRWTPTSTSSYPQDLPWRQREATIESLFPPSTK